VKSALALLSQYFHSPHRGRHKSSAWSDARRQRKRARLDLELLEDRTVPTAVAVPSGIVSWWTANNTANDVYGLNNATLTNVSYATGEVGQAFSFNGTNGWAALGDPSSLAFTQSFTIEGWIKVNGLPTNYNFGSIMFRGDDRGGLDPYQLVILPNGDLQFGIDSAANIGASIEAPIPTGQFVHVAATLDDATGLMTLYENGALVAQTTTTVRPFGPLDPTQQPGVGIGNSNDLSSYDVPFNGLIDELSVYNRALTASEVLGIYKAGSDGKVISPITVSDPVVVNGSGPVTFTITRTDSLSGSLAVSWTTADDTATAGTNYVAASGTVTFADGQATQTVAVTTLNDSTPEPNVDFELVATPSGGTSIMGLATVLTNNTTISVSNDTATEGGTSIRFLGAFVPPGLGGLGDAYGITYGPDGNVYVSTLSSSAVYRYDAAGNPLPAPGQSGAVFVPPGSGGLSLARDIDFGPDGYLYVVSQKTNAVLRYDPVTGTPAGSLIAPGTGGLDNPRGLLFRNGYVYVTNASGTVAPGMNTVMRFDAATGAAAGVSGVSGDAVFISSGSGGLANPSGIVFGSDGNAYVSSTASKSNSVLRYNGTTGAFIDVFVLSGSGGLDGPAGMVFRPDGYLYVVGARSNSVLRYQASSGAFVDAVVPSGSGGVSTPIDLLFDANGNLLVTSLNNDQVLRYGTTSEFAFTVSLGWASVGTTTIKYATADGTALAGQDYTAISGTLTFPPGYISQTVVVQTLDDGQPDPAKAFTINLSNPVGGAITSGQGIGTILDVTNFVLTATGINPVEGVTYTNPVASFTTGDSNATANDFTAAIDWGDGSTSSGIIFGDATDGFDIVDPRAYAEEGKYSLKVQVLDNFGSTATTTEQVQVLDAPLTPSPITLNPTEQTGFTGRVGSFTDSNPFAKASDFNISIDWGNGHTSAGTVVADNNGGFDVLGSNTYSEEGSFQVKVSVRDVGGSSTNMTSTAVVVDAPLTPIAVNLTGVEAATVSGQVGLFQDGFTNAPLTDFTTAGGRATINWGDGSQPVTGVVTQPGGQGTPFAVSGSHIYSDAGSYTVLVTLHDKSGSSATAISTVTVNDSPLSAVGIALQLVEGSPFTGQVAAFVDANPKATLATFTTGGGSVTIDWGDGTPVVPGILTQAQGPGTAFVVSGTHTFTDELSYTIHVAVKDRGGATTQSLASVLVLDARLTATGVALNAFDGTTFSGPVATFVDANKFAPLSDFSSGQGYIRIDWGDGFTSLGTVSQPGGLGSQFVASGTHTYAQVGISQIQVNIFDVGGSQVSATSTVSIGDAPIHLSTGSLTMTEALTFTGTVGTFVDLSSSGSLADFTTGNGGATIDWGDTFLSAGTITQSGGVGTPFVVSSSHVYQEEGNYTVKVKVTDRAGSQDQSSFTATVGDAPLSAVGALAKQFDGFTYTGTLATVTDANPAAPLTDFTTAAGSAIIDWGDSSPTTTGTITQPGGPGTPFLVQGTYTYAKRGIYAIKVAIQDVGGSSSTASTSLTLVHFDDLVGRNSQTGQWMVGISNGSNAFTNTAFGSWNPTQSWVDVQIGDFNGDGRPDVVGRNLNTGDWWVSLSNGTSFTTSDWGRWSAAVTWVDVQVGDFTGDGKTDIVGRYAQGGQWWMAESTGSSFVNSLWTTWNPNVTWVDVKIGDFNGDGKADIVGRFLQGGSWWVSLSTGSSFLTSQWAAWNPAVTWADVNIGDFNGDGKADIVARPAGTGYWFVGISTGASFNTSLWAIWSNGVTWADVRVGDFNGDGKADIIGRAMPYDSWWAGLSTGSSFQTNYWTSWSPSFTWAEVQVGDFNGDGKADLAGLALETGAWWTTLSTGISGVTNPWTFWSQAYSWVDIHVGDFG
jgi:hypothetical protein